MRMLAGHPRIVAHTNYPCELQLMRLTTDPARASADQSVFSFPFDGDEKLLKAPLREGLGIRPQDVHRIYRRIGRNLGHRPRYFIEKVRAIEDIGQILGGFPDLRMLLLVRDPRDVFLSVRAFNRRRGFDEFFEREKRDNTDEAAIVALKERYLAMIANASQVDSYTLRYEDLIERPKRSLRGVLAWLNLGAQRPILDAMLAFSNQYDDRHHVTSASPESSVSRWRAELPPQQRALIETELAEILARFGYD